MEREDIENCLELNEIYKQTGITVPLQVIQLMRRRMGGQPKHRLDTLFKAQEERHRNGVKELERKLKRAEDRRKRLA